MAPLLIGLFYIDICVGAVALMPLLDLGDGLSTGLHIAVSALNSFALMMVLRRIEAAVVVVFLATTMVELAQLIIAGRTASVDDLCANAIGISIGVAWALLRSSPRQGSKIAAGLAASS
jgi:VanZ family protein